MNDPGAPTSAERREHLQEALRGELSNGGRIESQTETAAVVVRGRRVNHLLHFLIGIFTLGLWWIVWALLALAGGEHRYLYAVDQLGNVTRTEQRSRLARLAPIVLGVLGALFLIGLIGSALGGGDEQGMQDTVQTDASPRSNQRVAATPASGTGRATNATDAPSTLSTQGSAASSNLTTAQRNAVRSAQSYLDFTGFSRQGLIDQLSSEYGDQYAVQDATVAVDSLNVDWNQQAVRSARSYLDFMGFSCQGLIDQLSSEYGDQYTVAQARYAATEVGLC